MQLGQYQDVYNSRDIINSFDFDVLPDHPNYTIVAQDMSEVQDKMRDPSISMGPFLMKCDLMECLPAISIYSRRGYDRAHTRLLYMSATALEIWKAMGMYPRQIGKQYRPPHTAVLSYGMPFND